MKSTSLKDKKIYIPIVKNLNLQLFETFQPRKIEARKMAQQLRPLAALVEDLGFVSSTHTVNH